MWGPRGSEAASRAEDFSQWVGPSPPGVRASFQLRPQEALTAAGLWPGGGRGVPRQTGHLPAWRSPCSQPSASRRIGQSQGLWSRDTLYRAGPVSVGTTSQPLLPRSWSPQLAPSRLVGGRGAHPAHTLAGKGARVRAPSTYRRRLPAGRRLRRLWPTAIRVNIASPVPRQRGADAEAADRKHPQQCGRLRLLPDVYGPGPVFRAWMSFY